MTLLNVLIDLRTLVVSLTIFLVTVCSSRIYNYFYTRDGGGGGSATSTSTEDANTKSDTRTDTSTSTARGDDHKRSLQLENRDEGRSLQNTATTSTHTRSEGAKDGGGNLQTTQRKDDTKSPKETMTASIDTDTDTDTDDDNNWRCVCETGFLPPGLLKQFGGMEAMVRMSTGQCYHKI
jgi:hypothetical protein